MQEQPTTLLPKAEAQAKPISELGHRQLTLLPMTKDENGKDVVQEATFFSESHKFRVTVFPVDEVITQQGLRGVPGSGVTCEFEGGFYSTPFKEVADVLRMLDDFGNNFRAHPADPTGYWRAEGVMELVEKTTTEVKMVGTKGPDVQVKRGATQVTDSPAVANPAPRDSTEQVEPRSSFPVNPTPKRPIGRPKKDWG